MSNSMRRFLSLASNVLLLVLSIAAGLVLFEGALTLLDLPENARPRMAHPANFVQSIKSAEFDFVFRTNDLGLKSPTIPLKKPAGRQRVLIVGDSFVEGHGVNVEDTLVGKLESNLRRQGIDVDFINGGLSGRGPVEYARVYFNLVDKYQLDGVVVCITYNDVSDTPAQLPPGAETGVLIPSPIANRPFRQLPRLRLLLDTVRTGGEVGEERRWQRDFLERTKAQAEQAGIPKGNIEAWEKRLPATLVADARKSEFNGHLFSSGLIIPRYLVESMDLDSPDAMARFTSVAKVLEAIRADAARRGVRSGIVYVPSYYQYYEYAHADSNPWRLAGMQVRREWLQNDTKLQQNLALWANGSQVPFLDLTPEFRSRATKDLALNFPLDAHWSAHGHEQAAQILDSWVTQYIVNTKQKVSVITTTVLNSPKQDFLP